MRLRLIHLLLAIAFMASTASVKAFSLLGTNAAWQTTDIGYQSGADIGGPQYRNEEFRRIYPHVVYRLDNTFVRDFGTQGVAQIRKAFNIMNNLGHVDTWSPNLAEFPKDAYRLNYSAQAQQLIDLKSAMMFLLTENLGVGQSPRFVWTIRSVTRATTFTNYQVIQMNYDPITWERTSYVNGRAHSYHIAVGPPVDDADEDIVGMVHTPFYYPVASSMSLRGYYYNGISYDDAGALRYIYRSSNYKYETLTNANPGLLVQGSYNNSSGYTIPDFGTNIYTDIWGNTTTNTIISDGWRAGLGQITYTEYDEGYPSNFVNWQDRVWNDDPTRNYYAQSVLQTLTRIVPKTVPDLLVFSTDSGSFTLIGDRTVRWRSNSAQNGQGYDSGPGQSDTGNTISFHKQLPMYQVTNPFFIYEDNRIISFRYGAFDGSTNAPEVLIK